MTNRMPIPLCLLGEEDPSRLERFAPGAFPGIDLLRVDPAALCTRSAPAAVLDVPDAAARDALEPLLRTAPMPVLVTAPAAEIDAVLAVLRPDDDVSPDGEPPALIARRLSKLQGLERMAERDPLTRLFNRGTFKTRLEHALEAARPEHPASLLLLNVDRFKAINDVHGHDFGDRVLQSLARLVLAHVDAEAFPGRVGGDVFAVLLSGSSEETSIAWGELLCGLVHGSPVFGAAVTVSIGVATTERPVPAETLLRQADEALYAAKAEGRDRVEHFRVRQRQLVERGRDIRIDGFENIQRVLQQRQSETIARRARRLFEALQSQADHDGLTGLFNRRYLDDRLDHEFHEARRLGRSLSLALIDVDYFGAINRTHGWPTGDLALNEVSRLVREQVRESDWVARYGGEELAVVLQGARLEESIGVMERVRAAIAGFGFRNTRGEPFAVTISIGVAELAEDETLAALKDRMSARLHDAKRGGRNQVRG